MLQMEGLDAVRRYKDEIAQLKSDIAELQRQKDRNEWLSVGAVSFQQLSRFKTFDAFICIFINQNS